MTPHDILAGAADLLEERSWCQGAMTRDGDGKPNYAHPESPALSLLGAMFVAAGLRDYHGPVDTWGWELQDDAPAWQAALDSVRNATGSHYLMDWNDDPARSRSEVIDVLRTAAEAVLRDGAEKGPERPSGGPAAGPSTDANAAEHLPSPSPIGDPTDPFGT